MRIGSVADAIELQVGVTQTGFRSGLAEFLRLRELDTIRRSLHRVVANLTGVGDSIEEVGRQGRLTAGELDRHLAARLDLDRIVQHGLDLVPRQFVDEANLVRVHEAGIAHHVATVGQIDGQHRTAAMGDGRGAVVVEFLIIVGADIAARENFFKMGEKLGIDRHDVFEVTVLGAILHHQDLAIALDDLRLDLANLLVQKDLVGQLAINNCLADLRNAFGAERVSRTGPAKGRLLFLIRLEQRLVRPLGGK